MKNFFNPRLKKTIRPKLKKKQLLFYNPGKKRSLIFSLGTGIFFFALAYGFYLYTPLLKSLVSYQWEVWFHSSRLNRKASTITPEPSKPTPTLPPVPDPSFSLIIPKINAEAKILPNIDPGNPEAYQAALQEGVAHAAGSGFPGSGKTIYLFAHSTNAEWNVVRYNAVFFLLSNLEPGDEVWVVFNHKLYPYIIEEKKVVGANEISYLTNYKTGQEVLILQTCWPPGTILKRLLVFARPK